MKQISVLFIFITISTLYAADMSNPYKPTIADASGQNFLLEFPTELKEHITLILANAGTLQEAGQRIRRLANVSREFNALINDSRVTKNIINMLVNKFGQYHETVAKALGTVGAREYIKKNKEALSWEAVETLQKAEALVASGADLNYSNERGSTAIRRVFKPDVFQYLIEQGANVNIITVDGETLLHHSIIHFEDPLVLKFLLQKIDQRLLNHKDQNGNTALHIVAQTGSTHKYSQSWYTNLQLLLDAGLDHDIRNSKNETVLDILRRFKRISYENYENLNKAIKLLEERQKINNH